VTFDDSEFDWARSGLLLVDASGRALVGSNESHPYLPSGARMRAVSPEGAVAWTVGFERQSAGFSFLASDLTLLLAEDSTWEQPQSRVSISIDDGTTLDTTTWPSGASRVVVGDDGTTFVDTSHPTTHGSTFSGIVHVNAGGTAQWTEAGRCDPGGDDMPGDHDFALRGRDLVLVCREAKGSGVAFLEVDHDDHVVLDAHIDGTMASDIAVTPSGHVVFLVTNDDKTTSLVEVGATIASITVGSPVLPLATDEAIAVARDDTFVVGATHAVVAASNGAIRWQAPIDDGRVMGLFVDPAQTIVADIGTAVIGIDLATGARRWQVPLPNGSANPDVGVVVSGGPGRVYALQAHALTLVSD